MNAYRTRTTPRYGYDGTQSSFQSTGTPIFGYDASANWLIALSLDRSAGKASSLRQFTGKERDTESGLDYFGARYYGSGLGRWTSADLLNLSEDRLVNPTNTLNKYVYGGNNPLKYVDPDGRDITVFYESPSLSPPGAGHILFTAENQQSGDAAVMSFGPIREGFGDAERMLAGWPQVSTSEFGLAGATADQLKRQYASLTI